MCEINDISNKIRSFIIIDLETTSLPNDKPVKITEIAMAAVMREHILDKGSQIDSTPRVQSKLNICVYPQRIISQDATDITKLSNELLEHQSPFDVNVFNILESFIIRMPAPVCLIAHNGKRFDFPALQAEIQNNGKLLPHYVMCADSLPCFRTLLQTTDAQIKTSTMIQGISPLNSEPKAIESMAETDPYWNDYDSELCIALDYVENNLKNPVKLHTGNIEDFETYNKGNVEAIKTNNNFSELNFESIEKEISLEEKQKQLERTPDRPIRLHAAGDNCNSKNIDMSSNRLRECRSVSRKVRKQLNFTQNTPKNFKLGNVYRYLYKKEPIDCHRAENDVHILLQCIVAVGQDFTDWVDKNAIPFNSIKKM